MLKELLSLRLLKDMTLIYQIRMFNFNIDDRMIQLTLISISTSFLISYISHYLKSRFFLKVNKNFIKTRLINESE